METVISAAVVVLGLSLLWSGRQRFAFNSFQATLLSILEVVGFVISAVALGWLGIGILLGVNLIAALVWSVILAAKKQSILTDASVQSADMSVEEAEEIWQWMRKQKAFAVLPPLERGELIRALAEQARSPSEIRSMAVAIAQLSVVFDYDAIKLAPRFDQMLRLYGKTASDSEEVADTLVAGTKHAAMSFDEMLVAATIVGGSSTDEQQGESAGQAKT